MVRKRRRRASLDVPEPLELVLTRSGENRFAKKQPPVARSLWSQVVGPRIVDRAQPVSLRDGVLKIRVTSNAWATELSLLSTQIVARLRVAGLAVESLRFYVGKLDLPPRPVERRTVREVPPPAPLPSSLQVEMSAVPDDELRRTLEDAARAQLGWMKEHDPDKKGSRRKPS